jgi:DNA-directed RNA polymerase specialized sigma24 family protein
VLESALTRLTPQEQLILRLRFDEGLPMPAIGRLVGVSGRRLYGRVERVLASLRQELEDRGITADDAADVLARRGFDRTPPVLSERRQP